MTKPFTLDEEQAAILQGLKSEQKFINPKYFYNHHGSKLFEQITELDEYYPTRTERKILQSRANDIAQLIEPNSLIVEPGAGSCKKIEYLLEALHPSVYVPQDVSAEFLKQSAQRLSSEYPWLDVVPVASDFSDPIEIPERLQDLRKYAFYPGSTIGNFEPEEALTFLKQMRQLVGNTGGMILGVDLHKDDDILHAAYNDKKGITAEFNLNTLAHINEILDATFNISEFEHVALYNSQQQRIEMYLKSLKNSTYDVLGETVTFEKGELVHTEHSYKYSIEGIAALAQDSGFLLKHSWTDNKDLFSVNYLQAQ
ncbi:L-histidine N(alpha)-methyltransferase [Kangiella geojedonensis]|uniref:Methyltransferase n=1 Tax=Kangiella geojedonensis TaxID=914150 RepID=A0A0F6RC92_9GAMM|nr:L-histidine N(alpha)-methyltransferase [Kangiella geojedonensis]AKE52238.1 Methyltransferase [Kangiella geojedonensis]